MRYPGVFFFFFFWGVGLEDTVTGTLVLQSWQTSACTVIQHTPQHTQWQLGCALDTAHASAALNVVHTSVLVSHPGDHHGWLGRTTLMMNNCKFMINAHVQYQGVQNKQCLFWPPWYCTCTLIINLELSFIRVVPPSRLWWPWRIHTTVLDARGSAKLWTCCTHVCCIQVDLCIQHKTFLLDRDRLGYYSHRQLQRLLAHVAIWLGKKTRLAY